MATNWYLERYHTVLIPNIVILCFSVLRLLEFLL
jgi:hypothetical protein